MIRFDQTLIRFDQTLIRFDQIRSNLMRFIKSGTFFKVPTKTKCSQQQLFGIGDGQGMKQHRFLAKGVGGANVSALFVVLPVAGWEEVGGFRGGGDG